MKLPPEKECGNTEYKLKIIPSEEFRLDQLTSQMKWRIDEGNGIAFYYLGINDNGDIEGINNIDFGISMKNLSKMTKNINAKIVEVQNNNFSDKFWYLITISYIREYIKNHRIIIIGPSSSGKTTLISNIVNNIKDNGNGRSRNLVFNHKHEIYSGRTSSLSIEKKIIKVNLDKINLTFIDTPGYSKYLKTTICALCKYDNSLILLCIDPLNTSILDLNLYMKILNFFEISYLIVFTKKDLYKSKHKLEIIKNILKSKEMIYTKENEKIIPYIEINNLTRFGYKKLFNYFYNLDYNNYCNINLKFQICDIIKIPNIGKIYTGILINGILEKNKKYFLSDSESLKKVQVSSIYYLDEPYDCISNNQLISIQLKEDNFSNKTGKLITDKLLSNEKSLFIRSDIDINFNSGICIYNNQYCVVRIKKLKDYYELSNKDGFINISDKIVLKINDLYYFTNLIKTK